jgi:hypothetical protein
LEVSESLTLLRILLKFGSAKSAIPLETRENERGEDWLVTRGVVIGRAGVAQL